MISYRKPMTLAIIAGFAIALAFARAGGAAGILVIAFLLYLVFGDDE